MCETVPEVCEGDIPSYYPLFPNRLFCPFVDQLHCKFTVLTLLHLYRTDDCWKTFCTVLCHTQITEYTFKMHEIKKNNHSKHCSIERAFNSKLPADDSISRFKSRTTDVHVVPGLMLIMLNLSLHIFRWFTTLLPKRTDHRWTSFSASATGRFVVLFSNRSYTCHLANRHLMLYGFSIFPNSERGHTWKQPNAKACSLRAVWEVYGYSMVCIENQ